MKKYLIVLAGLVLIMSSCRYRSRHVRGNGASGTEQRSVTGFTGIETHGDIDIIAAQGDFNVRVSADQNILQYIETVVVNGRLMVRFKNGISLRDYDEAKVYVTAPDLNAFETHGSGDITSQGKIAGKDKMQVAIYGSGDIKLHLDCPEINTETHGSGDIELEGETKNLSGRTSGSGDMKASRLKAENVKISVSGSGDTEVFASESLDVEVTGSGDVNYKGSPKISTNVHGSGSVSKME